MRRCYEKLDEETRRSINEGYWKDENLDNQRLWISKQVKFMAPKRRYAQQLYLTRKEKTSDDSGSGGPVALEQRVMYSRSAKSDTAAVGNIDLENRISVAVQTDQGYMKKLTSSFFLPGPHSGQNSLISQIEVCQKMFLNTLGYKSDEILKTVKQSLTETGHYKKRHAR